MVTINKAYPVAVVSDKLVETIFGAESDELPLESMAEYEALDGNIAYIRIWSELDEDMTGRHHIF